MRMLPTLGEYVHLLLPRMLLYARVWWRMVTYGDGW